LETKKTLLKEERLLKPSEFQSVYKNGKWSANREIAVNFRPSDKPFPSLGITVSKKVSKLAVDRNRIKRLIREWFRHNKNQFKNIELIITAKPALNSKTNEQVFLSLNDVCRKIKKAS